jgi:biopolymer transport protein TolR
MASTQQASAIISGINVTPLVDVTLVLLIIFIVTAKLIVTPAVPLDLPHARASQELQSIFAISVPVSGPALVNGVVVANDEMLLARARDAWSRNHELRAVIQADGSVPHRRVIHILDSMKRAGIAHVAFGALPEDEAAP